MINLRAFTQSDAIWYAQITKSAGDISRYVPGVVGTSVCLTADLVRAFSLADFETEFDFVICNEIGTPVGALFASQDLVCNSLSVSYFIGNTYRNHGYMYSALMEFKNYCKTITNYHSLIFDIAMSNIKSKRLIEKLGAKSTGIFDEYFFSERFERYELKL